MRCLQTGNFLFFAGGLHPDQKYADNDGDKCRYLPAGKFFLEVDGGSLSSLINIVRKTRSFKMPGGESPAVLK